jgi:nickel-dependent lactate racemase
MKEYPIIPCNLCGSQENLQRQAIKAMCTADIVCRKDGVIILPAECPEGIAPQFPTFESYGFGNPEGLYRDVEQGVCREKLLAYTLVAVGRIMKSRRATILVSPNISNTRAKRLGFVWAPDMKTALEKARNLMGKNTSTLILRQAGELLPLCIGGS